MGDGFMVKLSQDAVAGKGAGGKGVLGYGSWVNWPCTRVTWIISRPPPPLPFRPFHPADHRQ